jgi:hypothetical protein
VIEFHPHALDELRDAQQWYRTKSIRAAERFFEAVNQAIARMAADPVSHNVR